MTSTTTVDWGNHMDQVAPIPENPLEEDQAPVAYPLLKMTSRVSAPVNVPGQAPTPARAETRTDQTNYTPKELRDMARDDRRKPGEGTLAWIGRIYQNGIDLDSLEANRWLPAITEGQDAPARPLAWIPPGLDVETPVTTANSAWWLLDAPERAGVPVEDTNPSDNRAHVLQGALMAGTQLPCPPWGTETGLHPEAEHC